MNKVLILFSLVLLNLGAFSQDSTKTTFSLTEAQEYALQNNKKVLNAKLDIDKSKKKIWETTAIGLPQVNASASSNYNMDLPVTLMPAKIFDPNAPDGTILK